MFRGLRAGASGLKDVAPEELVRAIRLVAEGESLLSPTVTRRLIEEFVRTPDRTAPVPAELGTLTEREREVLASIGHGLTNQEIAERLFLSMATVKTHVNRVFAKLGLHDRAQAVVLAYETGVVLPARPRRRAADRESFRRTSGITSAMGSIRTAPQLRARSRRSPCCAGRSTS